jgi:hypothetical protein
MLVALARALRELKREDIVRLVGRKLAPGVDET